MQTHPAEGFSASAANKPSSSRLLSPSDSISFSKSRNSNFSLLDILRFLAPPPPLLLLLPSLLLLPFASLFEADLPPPGDAEEEFFFCAAASSVSSLSAAGFAPPPPPVLRGHTGYVGR